jgi:hypothetical protein
VDPTVLAKAEPWVKLLFDRFDYVENANKDRFDRVDQTLEKVADRQEKTEEELKNLQSEVTDLRSDVEGVEETVGQLKSDFETHKEEVEKLINDRLAKFEARANAVSTQVPSLTVAQQCSVEDKFRALLKEADAMRTIFVIGKVPNSRQAVSLTVLLQRHFEEHGAKLLPLLGKARTRRFSVPSDKVEITKETVRHYNLAIRDLGYWVVQDSPPALRRMNSSAFAFFKFCKDRFKPLRRFRYEAEGGYVFIDDTQLFPVYMVPTKQSKWSALAKLILELTMDWLCVDWLEAASAPFELPATLMENWCAVLQSAGGEEEEEPETPDDEDITDTHMPDAAATSGGG